MNNDVKTEYNRLRLAHPEWAALQTLRAARYNVKMRNVELPGYAGDSVRVELPRGEYIVMKIEPDNDADLSERLQFDTESARYDDVTKYADSGWIDRDGRVLFDGFGPRVEWQWWSDSYGFSQFWEDGKRSLARHAAWLSARQMVSQSFDYARKISECGYVGYVVTLYDASGTEIEEETCWGFEADGNFCAQDAYAVVESMIASRARQWETEVNSARQRAASIRATARDIISDMRKATGANLPHAREALRAHLAAMRRDHTSAVATIAGA